MYVSLASCVPGIGLSTPDMGVHFTPGGLGVPHYVLHLSPNTEREPEGSIRCISDFQGKPASDP